MLKDLFRPRNYLLVIGSLLVLLYTYFADPEGGPMLIGLLDKLTVPIIAVWFAHLSRKALFDYLDMGELWKKAKESSIGAAITFLAICLVLFGLLGLFGNQVRAQDVTTYIPKNAITYIPEVKAQQGLIWGDHPKAGTLQG